MFNAYWYAGMHDEALAVSENNYPPDQRKFYGQLAEGNVAGARATLESLEGLEPWSKGSKYAMVGEPDLAIEWVTKAVDEGYHFVMFYKTSVLFDPLRDDPRFHDLLLRMNLMP